MLHTSPVSRNVEVAVVALLRIRMHKEQLQRVHL